MGNPYLFNGRRYDEETGFYYYRSRNYNPELERFINRDTIGIWGDPSNLGNGYTYVANNPWTYVDPFGEDGGLTIAGGATITAIVAYPVDVGSQALANAIYGRPLGEGVVGPLTFLGQGVSYVDGLIRRSPTYDPVKNKISEVTFNRLDNTTANLDHGVANAQVGLFNEGVNNHPLNNLNTFSASFGDHVANELHWAAAVGSTRLNRSKFVSYLDDLPKGGTYLLRNLETEEVMRTGRTNNFVRRAGEHARDPILKQYRFERVDYTDNYFEQRGLEQILHKKYNPPLNKKNPIWTCNPMKPVYMNSARKFLERSK